jgi:YD repeat-containing protein
MKIQYFSETDTLAIELTTKPVATTDAITHDLILDYDNDGKLVAITLDNYSQNVETVNLQALGVPLLAA